MELTLQTVALWVRTVRLRRRVAVYSRMLQAIAVQRKNDFEAERMLHRLISCANSDLRLLEHDPRVANHNDIALPTEKFRPRIVKLVQKNRD